MKKLFVVLGVVAFGFAFTSCKKECKCTLLGVTVSAGDVIDNKDDCLDLKEGGLNCEWK